MGIETIDEPHEDDWLQEEYARKKLIRQLVQHRSKEIYERAKAAKTGDTCTCAGCGKGFTKKSYQQAFCSNKGRGNCKDTFWNRASDERMARAKQFSVYG